MTHYSIRQMDFLIVIHIMDSMNTAQPPYVFISHSHQDKEFARFLNERLQRAGFATWLDVERIPEGSTWAREIENGVENCGALVVVMSKNARESEWVERETLMAMNLRKPIFIARVDDVRLPIYVINRQFSDFRTRPDTAAKRLILALQKISLTDPLPEPSKPSEAAKLAPEPNQTNFFKYIKQLPEGEAAARIAEDLYKWSDKHADDVVFSGWTTPVYHVRVLTRESEVTVLSLWAYSRQPAVEVAFRYLQYAPPYDERQLRLSTLDAINNLMPDGKKFPDDRADRRPHLPLIEVLATPDALKTFKAIIQEIIDNLRSD